MRRGGWLLALAPLLWLVAPQVPPVNAGAVPGARAESRHDAEPGATTSQASRSPAEQPAPAAPPADIRFEEIGAAAGARLGHHTRVFHGPYADVLGMFTAGGAAVAVGDYDGDGDDDLFVTDSDAGRPNHLLRNDFVPTGKLRFTDVTAAAGVAGGNDPRSIVADALWFDADNDGRDDLLVARFGTPILYRNLGGGRFADVSAGERPRQVRQHHRRHRLRLRQRRPPRPAVRQLFPPINLIDLPTSHVLPNNLDDADNGGGVTLWHNETAPGGSAIRFVERTTAAGLGRHTGWTLDVGHADLDDDGFQDLYLADDYGTDRLFFNRGDGTFRDATEEAIGFDTRKGMNVDVGDYNRDGRLDVYVTNITDEYMHECNMLWSNNGDRTFTDVAKETGVCNSLWGWAAKFADFDDDGWEDLFVADGLRSAGPENYIPVLVEMIIRPGVDFTDLASWPPIGGMTWSGYQKKKLFHNLAGQLFKEIAAEAGVDNDRDGRGVGVADFDGDGRLDFFQANARQPSLLYRNTTANAGHWVEAKLVGTRSNRDAIGARLTVTAGGVTQIREVDGGNGYASQSSFRLHVGLGATTRVDSAVVRWPSGRVESFELPVDRVSVLVEGRGAARP